MSNIPYLNVTDGGREEDPVLDYRFCLFTIGTFFPVVKVHLGNINVYVTNDFNWKATQERMPTLTNIIITYLYSTDHWPQARARIIASLTVE